MGEFTRNYNWSATPLGSPDNWSRSLRTLLRMMLANPLPMAMLWGSERITFYNDAFAAMLDSSGKQAGFLGQYGKESWAGLSPVLDSAVLSVLAGGEAITKKDTDLQLVSKDATRSQSFYFSPLTDDSDGIGGVLITGSESTGRTENAGEFGHSEECFQNLIGNASVSILVLSVPGLKVEIINDSFAAVLGRHADEIRGTKFDQVIPEVQQNFLDFVDRVCSTGEAQYLYAQPGSIFKKNTEEEKFLDLVFQPYTKQQGQIIGVTVICNDVTQQVLDNRMLQKSEIRLRSVVESAPFPIGVYTGPEMVIELVNQSIIDIWGKGSDLIGKRYADVLPELAGKGIYEQLDSVYRTGKAYYAHNQRVDLLIDGVLKPFYFKYTFTPLFNSEGSVYGVMNTAADVTDLVLAQQQQQEAEAGLRGAIELAQLGSWELDPLTGQVYYSEVIQEWFGFGDTSVTLSEVYNPIHPDDRKIVEDAVRQALEADSSGIYDAEYRLVSYLTNTERIVHARGKVLYDNQGQAYKLAGTAQDVTAERKREEALEHIVQLRTRELAVLNEELAAHNEEYLAINEELEEANRLLVRSNENLQQFAYVASHDLQEPLRKIQQFGDILKMRYIAESGEARAYLDRMQAAASRMSALIRDLLDFSSISTLRDANEAVNLNEIVVTVLNDLELVVAESEAAIEIGLLPIVHGNAIQLGQLFQNLLANALKFRQFGTQSIIEVKSRMVPFSELPSSVKPTRLTAKYHQIEVIDNGIGFDEKYANRIFQVFQRLHGKNEYAGTGIGLAICEKVVSSHGGAISAVGRLGHGATFIIYLPV